MSGQQSSIDISASPLMCMAVCMSSDDMATPDADAPTGSIARDMAMANARMVRTSCINIDMPFGTSRGLSNILAH